jgi:hypothetical protein
MSMYVSPRLTFLLSYPRPRLPLAATIAAFVNCFNAAPKLGRGIRLLRTEHDVVVRWERGRRIDSGEGLGDAVIGGGLTSGDGDIAIRGPGSLR